MTLFSTIASFLIAVLAGAFGSVLGIGGGLFIIPSLTLFLGIKLKTAIAASIVAVIATSLGGGNLYLRQRLANMKLGLVLALATAPAGIVGALLATRLHPRFLAAAFALMLIFGAYQMFHARVISKPSPSAEPTDGESRLDLAGTYYDSILGRRIEFQAARLPLGAAISVLAGLISGLLGVGGGVVQVPVMHLIMRVPLKVALATSTYIIGITAMAGAFIYYNHSPSFVDPALTVPVTIGVFIGASVGSRLLQRFSPSLLANVFMIVLLLYAIQMGLRAFGIGG